MQGANLLLKRAHLSLQPRFLRARVSRRQNKNKLVFSSL